jgi:hypothetical protein
VVSDYPPAGGKIKQRRINMIYVVITAVVLMIVGVILLNTVGDFPDVMGGILIFISSIIFVTIPFLGYSWVAAKTKAEIINREYGTHYTREEIFYANDVIDTIQQIKRKRIEVSGDLFKDTVK